MPRAHRRKKSHRMAHRSPTLPIGMQETTEIPSAAAHWPERRGKSFTPMETGEPGDETTENRRGRTVPAENGPLNEEGQGDRQNDELAELELIEPDIKLD